MRELCDIAIVFTCSLSCRVMALMAQGIANAQSEHPDRLPSPGESLPQGTSRVYIALRNGVDGSGASMADARDGSTVTAFDTILRCYSEGCTGPQNSGKSVAKTENLIVCLGPGTFSTMGSYDFIIAVPHTTANGFTIGKGWKIHGAGKDKTTVKLSDYLPITDPKNPAAICR